MLETLTNISSVLLPVAYTILIAAYARRFVGRPRGLGRVSTQILWGVVALHATSLLLRAAKAQTCPVNSQGEIFSIVAFTIVAIYIVVELRLRQGRSTGLFVISSAFLAQLISSVMLLDPDFTRSEPLGFWPSLHVFVAIVGLSAVAVTSLYAILFLVLYRAIEKGRYGIFFQRMPDLQSLSKVNFGAALIAFILLTVTSLLGGYRATEGNEANYLRVALSIVLWLCYAIGVFGYSLFSLSGRRLAHTTLAGLVPAISVLIIGVLESLE